MVGKQELQICTAILWLNHPPSLLPCLPASFYALIFVWDQKQSQPNWTPWGFPSSTGTVTEPRAMCRAHITHGQRRSCCSQGHSERAERKKEVLWRKLLPSKLTSHVMTSSDLLPPPPLTSDGGISGTVERKCRDVCREWRQENTPHPPMHELTHIHTPSAIRGNVSGVAGAVLESPSPEPLLSFPGPGWVSPEHLESLSSSQIPPHLLCLGTWKNG